MRVAEILTGGPDLRAVHHLAGQQALDHPVAVPVIQLPEALPGDEEGVRQRQQRMPLWRLSNARADLAPRAGSLLVLQPHPTEGLVHAEGGPLHLPAQPWPHRMQR